MPKVAFISSGFGTKIGGLGLYAEVVTNELEKIGVEPIRISLSSTPCDYQVSSTCRFPNYFVDPHFKQQLEDILLKNRPDIIHLNIASPQVVMLVKDVLEKLNQQFMLTVHSYVFLCPTDWYVKLPDLRLCNDSWFHSDCMKCIYLNQVQHKQSAVTKAAKFVVDLSRATIASPSLRMMLRKAKTAISPSKKLADALRCGLGSENITHIYNPVPRKLLSQKPCPEGDGTVLFMNRLVSEKGVHLLPKFAKLLGSETKINVIGKGPLSEWFGKCKSDKIVYHGFVPEKVKTDMLKNCSAVIVPSIRAECFPYIVLEAFSLGKPVVGFALGGVEEQIKESQGGMLATPFNTEVFARQIRYLLENTDEAMTMGLNGRKWIEKNCDPQLYAKNLLQTYKELY